MNYECQIRRMPVRQTITIRGVATEGTLGDVLMQMLPKVAAHMESKGATMAGPPFTRYHAFERDRVEMEAGVPVNEPVEGDGDVQPSELPGGECAVTMHVGPYDRLGEAYGALEKFIAEQSREIAGGPWEVYETDPETAPPEEWKTEIFYPLK